MNEKTPIPKNIDEYISGFPEDVQIKLKKIRETIRKEAPDAVETISYQIPTFKGFQNLVHFAAFTNHIGFYPSSSGIEKFKTELAGYKTSRGTVQFPLDQPVPYDLIRRITAFRVAEDNARAEAKKNKKK